MALKKQIPTPLDPTGRVAYVEYWRVRRVDIDAKQARVVIELEPYVDAQARDDDGRPYEPMVRKFALTGARFTEFSTAPPEGTTMYEANATAAYRAVKTATMPVPNPAFDPAQPEGPANPVAVEGPGEFVDAEDV